MIEVGGQNQDSLPTSGQLLATEAMKRQWRMWTYVPGEEHYRFERPDGKHLEVFASMPPATTGATLLRTDDKYIAQQLLEEHDFPVLTAHKISEDVTTEAILEQFPYLFENDQKWVIKPLDRAHGYGVTTAICSRRQLDSAVRRARRYSSNILLQEYYGTFVDVRILCIDYTYTAAAVRVPARVQGDGIHTVKELISIENQRGVRAPLNRGLLTYIDLECAESYLGEKMNEVPLAGEWYTVSEVANISMGGEAIDATERIPHWLRQMAERAARMMQLPVCGVDFLLSAEPSISSAEEDLRPVIIELNKAPGLRVHEHPAVGVSQPVVARFFDYLERI